MHRYASVPNAPTVLRSRPVPRARPARCPPALRSQQPETSAPRPWCARGAQVLPHVLPGILSLSGPRESIPGPGLPETNAKLVARRDGRLAYYTQRRGGCLGTRPGGLRRAAQRGPETPLGRRRSRRPTPRAASGTRARPEPSPAVARYRAGYFPCSTSRWRENDTDRRVRHVNGGGCFAAAEGESTPLATAARRAPPSCAAARGRLAPVERGA